MKLTRAKAQRRDPVAILRARPVSPPTDPACVCVCGGGVEGAKIFTRKTIAEKLVNLNELNASSTAAAAACGRRPEQQRIIKCRSPN